MGQPAVDPWGVKSVSPAPAALTAGTVDPWGPASGIPAQPAGLPAGVTLPGLPDHPAVEMQSARGFQSPNPYLDSASPVDVATANAIKGTVKSIPGFVRGVAKSIPGTMAGIAKLAPGASDAVDPLEAAAQTNGTAEAVGKGVGNAAQFLIPGGAEEEAAAKIAPMVGKFGAKVAAGALGSGTVNKLQGGSFTDGALAGATGSVVNQGVQKVAPMVAEIALGARAADRAYGRTPGNFILDETKGTDPGSIAEQARNKVSLYSGQLDQNAIDSPGQVNLQPAKDKAASWMQTAALRNNDATSRQVAKIGTQLDARGEEPIGQFVSAREGLALKRGLDDLPTSWNPATAPDFSKRAVTSTVQELHPELENAIPGYRDLNAKISTGMPVAQRAGAADLNAGVLQRALGRFGKPTGALAGMIGGGYGGYKEGGTAGAVAGGALGLFAPEVITSPTTMMMGARALDSPVLQKGIIPMAQGAALQFTAKKPKGLYNTH